MSVGGLGRPVLAGEAAVGGGTVAAVVVLFGWGAAVRVALGDGGGCQGDEDVEGGS